MHEGWLFVIGLRQELFTCLLLLLGLCAWYFCGHKCVPWGTSGGQRITLWKWSLFLSLLVLQESNSGLQAYTSAITRKPSSSPHLCFLLIYLFILSWISGIQKLWILTVRTPGYVLTFAVVCRGGYRTRGLVSVKSVFHHHATPSQRIHPMKWLWLGWWCNRPACLAVSWSNTQCQFKAILEAAISGILCLFRCFFTTSYP